MPGRAQRWGKTAIASTLDGRRVPRNLPGTISAGVVVPAAARKEERMIESFRDFMEAKYPGICRLCCGEGKIEFIGPATGLKLVDVCPDCNGSGKAAAIRKGGKG